MFNHTAEQNVNSLNSEGLISKTVIAEKLFQIDNLCYQYQNKYRIERTGLNPKVPVLKIKNTACEMKGNQLKKITEIEYADKKIYIEDVYILSEFSENPDEAQSKEQESSNKNFNAMARKFCLFRKVKGKEASVALKRNTKNVAKNFIKAFVNYMRTEKSMAEKSVIQACIEEVKELVGSHKTYNNMLIWKIVSSSNCKEPFRQFLSQMAKEWIDQSKITDKSVHYQAIAIYLNLYDKMFFECDQNRGSGIGERGRAGDVEDSRDKEVDDVKEREEEQDSEESEEDHEGNSIKQQMK